MRLLLRAAALFTLAVTASLPGCGDSDASSPAAASSVRVRPRPPIPKRRAVPEPAEQTLALRSLQLFGDLPAEMARLLGEGTALPEALPRAIADQGWGQAAELLTTDELAGRLAGSALYWSLRADVLQRAGREDDARAAIERALEHVGERSHAIYHTWRRARALGVQPPEGEAERVLGVVMEVGYPEGLLFVVAWADGGASLYFGGGGGVIGGQAHAPVRAAAARVNHVMAGLLFELNDTTRHPLPPVGVVRLTALLPAGARAAVVPTSALKSGGPTLAPVYLAMQRLIARLREYSEQAGAAR